jgi:hypothetical protein
MAEAARTLVALGTPVALAPWSRFSFVEEVERGVDFLELALDFLALARIDTFLQPLQQSLLSRNEFCNDFKKGGCSSFIGWCPWAGTPAGR